MPRFIFVLFLFLSACSGETILLDGDASSRWARPSTPSDGGRSVGEVSVIGDASQPPADNQSPTDSPEASVTALPPDSGPTEIAPADAGATPADAGSMMAEPPPPAPDAVVVDAPEVVDAATDSSYGSDTTHSTYSDDAAPPPTDSGSVDTYVPPTDAVVPDVVIVDVPSVPDVTVAPPPDAFVPPTDSGTIVDAGSPPDVQAAPAPVPTTFEVYVDPATVGGSANQFVLLDAALTPVSCSNTVAPRMGQTVSGSGWWSCTTDDRVSPYTISFRGGDALTRQIVTARTVNTPQSTADCVVRTSAMIRIYATGATQPAPVTPQPYWTHGWCLAQ